MAKRKHTSSDTEYKVKGDGLQPRDMWRTPTYILDCVRKLMGGQIIYDPATDAENPTGAQAFGTPECPIDFGPATRIDGLFLNPPFSQRNAWVGWFAVAVGRGFLLVPYETAPAFASAKEQGWVLIKPKGRIAFDTPPVDGIVNEGRPGGPTILFAKGYKFEDLCEAFPYPEFTVWRST